MERRRGKRVCVDVTLVYDLSTCLLRLSSDQSSLCQPLLPAGSFSMHVTPILLFLICYLSLLVVFINFLSISWSLSNLSSFYPFLGSRAARYSFTLPLSRFPLYLPLSAFSHIISPCPLVLSASLAVASPEDVTKRNKGRGVRDRWK